MKHGSKSNQKLFYNALKQASNGIKCTIEFELIEEKKSKKMKDEERTKETDEKGIAKQKLDEAIKKLRNAKVPKHDKSTSEMVKKLEQEDKPHELKEEKMSDEWKLIVLKCASNCVVTYFFLIS